MLTFTFYLQNKFCHNILYLSDCKLKSINNSVGSSYVVEWNFWDKKTVCLIGSENRKSPQPCSLWFFLQSYQWFPNLSRTCGNHLLDAQPSHQHHARCLYKVCRPPSIRLTRDFPTSEGQIEVIYFQHKLFNNITQDAFTRYVDLLPLGLSETS